MGSEDESKFDAAKAELFEAVGHPNRIRILQALDGGPVGFADLKKKVGMESSGHLSFHLGKLDHLVALNPEGRYTLTGEGREALSMIQTVREKGNGRWTRPSLGVGKPLVAVLLAAIVVLAAFGAIQQLEITNLSSPPPGTTLLDGKPYWYAAIPSGELPKNQSTTAWVGGVEFILTPLYSRMFVVVSPGLANLTSPSGGGNFTVVVTFSANGTAAAPQGILVTTSFLPNYDVQVKFPDGAVETFGADQLGVSGTASAGSGSTGSLWFSAHALPRVAVSENATSITLYVGYER